MSMHDDTGKKFADVLHSEDGHAYAYGGGSLIAIVLIVLLLIWLL